jgi:hypothetical protein
MDYGRWLNCAWMSAMRDEVAIARFNLNVRN